MAVALPSSLKNMRSILPPLVPVPAAVAMTRTMKLRGFSSGFRRSGGAVFSPPSLLGMASMIWPSVGAGLNVMMKNASSWNDMSSMGVMGRSGSTKSVPWRRRLWVSMS